MVRLIAAEILLSWLAMGEDKALEAVLTFQRGPPKVLEATLRFLLAMEIMQQEASSTFPQEQAHNLKEDTSILLREHLQVPLQVL
jgi:hypothetical protein